MKKALTILVAMLFLVVAVGVAYSAETTFNGQYRVRAWSSWNFDKKPNHIASENGLYTGFFDQRFRLTITHTRSEYLKAVVQIDLVEDTWGQQRNFMINGDTSELIRWAYLEFTLPKIGTFDIGKFPVILGSGLAFSNSTNAFDGIKWSNKWGMVGLSAMYFKMIDNVTLGKTSQYYNRDSAIWALDMNITPNENQNIELFGGYVRYAAGWPMSHNTAYMLADWPNVHANVGFAGLAYTGEFNNMISVKAEVSGVFGRADLRNIYTGVDDAFVGGLNVYLDAAYHNDMLKVGLAFVLGTGDTADRWAHHKYNVNYIAADEFAFGNIIASGNGGLNDDFGGGLGLGDDVENLTAVKLYFECNPMEKLSLNAAVIWAKWTQPVGVGTPYTHPVNYHDITGFVPAHKSTDLGWEVDLGLSYQIMEGLTYNLAAGVLFTGDSFDYMSGGTEHDWGPIWLVNNNLTYEF